MSTDREIRCAIYTRTSSRVRLDQQFNSLDAQRASCEQFIKSQAGEGWTALPDRFDDGGSSGGTLERPALQQLLEEVRRGNLDAVVVYKVDRLTRSLADFVGLVSVFEQKDIAFVSVTQCFNTKDPAGRLTLNVLLAFAQFERELVGERIRDKIAASKAKGMWMGGLPPLGYDRPTDGSRALVMNAAEASSVRRIFELYRSTRNILTLQRKLAAEGIRSKPRRSNNGQEIGNKDFSRGALRHLLQNRVYLGETTHKGASHAGRHTPLIDEDLFSEVQSLLSERSRRRTQYFAERGSAWRGKVYDHSGRKMWSVWQIQRGRGYGYFKTPGPRDPSNDAIRRLPVSELDRQIMSRLEALIGEVVRQAPKAALRASLRRVEIGREHLHFVFDRAALAVLGLGDTSDAGIISRLPPGDRLVADTDPGQVGVLAPGRMKLRGGRTWAQHPDRRSAVVARSWDPEGLDQIRHAHRTLVELSRAACAQTEEALVEASIALLAPDLQEAVLNGHLEPAAMRDMKCLEDLPLSWTAQRALFQDGLGGHVERTAAPGD